MGTNVSDYISTQEYACKCCSQLPPAFACEPCMEKLREFFADFKAVREAWGKPITISCGYRCPAHNAAVGGEKLSAHQWGLALDCDFESVADVDLFVKCVDATRPDLRMGTYNTGGKSFVHIDAAYLINPKAAHEWRKGARW